MVGKLIYSYESLVTLYGALIGDAIVIQPVLQKVLPEENTYDVVDVWWQLCEHFHQVEGTPRRSMPDLTRRNLTMRQCIQYAEHCLVMIKRYGGANHPPQTQRIRRRDTRAH